MKKKVGKKSSGVYHWKSEKNRRGKNNSLVGNIPGIRPPGREDGTMNYIIPHLDCHPAPLLSIFTFHDSDKSQVGKGRRVHDAGLLFIFLPSALRRECRKYFRARFTFPVLNKTYFFVNFIELGPVLCSHN